MKNILLISPKENDFYRGREAYPSGALLLFGTLLVNKGYNVKIVHTATDNIDNEKLKKIVLEFNPSIVAITMNSFQTKSAREISGIIKQTNKDILIMTGGAHPSALELEILKDFPDMDVAVIGEGEDAFMEIIEGKPLNEIKGICYQGIKNPPREYLANLDNIPLTNLGLIDIKKFTGCDPIFGFPSMFVMASRGCPFQCIFCNKSIYGHNVRFRKAEAVIKEIEHLHKNYGIREIFFQDDTFNLKRDWAEEIFNSIIREKLNKNIAYKVSFRANKNLIDEDLLRLAKKANVKMIFYGVESGNQMMLDTMKKGLKIDEIKRAFQLTHKVGIKTLGAFIIGLPGETKETVNDTIKFWEEIHPYVTGCGAAIPFPKTEFDTIVKQKNHKLDPSYDNHSYGQVIIKTDALDENQIKELFLMFRRKIIKKFFLDLIKLRYLNELLLAVQNPWYVPYIFRRIKSYLGF